MQRVMMIAVMMTGLFFFGAGQAKAQADCNGLPNKSKEQSDCWVTKAKSGDKYLSEANLSGADLSDAVVSRSTTKGVDFDTWRKRGGTVND